MAHNGSEEHPARNLGPAAKRIANATALLLLLGALALQGRAASFLFGLSLQGDPPKHFVSGVLVYDYLRHGLGSNPLRFAESFEVQYPLVSIGHWPPMYYAVQAAFYFLAGPFLQSAQALSALMAACLALLIFLCLRRPAGAANAVIAVAVFLAAPLLQLAAWQVMSDLLTALFVFLALLAFARLLDHPGNGRAAAAFAVWAVAAILTKGSAWALGPFFLLAPLFARRRRFLRSRWFFGTMLAVGLAGASFYLAAQRSGIGYPVRYEHYLTVGFDHRMAVVFEALHFAPPLLIGLSVLGAAEAIDARWRRGDESAWATLSLAAAAWAASQLLFLLVLPMTPEPRVLLPALAPAAVLLARLLQALQLALRRKPILAAAAPAILGALVVLNGGPIPAERLDGYRQAADAMAYPPDGALILVATNDWGGEAEIIAERLSHGRAHRDVLLRGSHVLGEVDAAGNDRPRFSTAEALRAYLLAMPVRYIVLSSPPYDFSYQSTIESAVTSDPGDFRLIARIPVAEQPKGQFGEFRIYENPAGAERHPSVVETPTGYDAGRRILEYRWK